MLIMSRFITIFFTRESWHNCSRDVIVRWQQVVTKSGLLKIISSGTAILFPKIR